MRTPFGRKAAGKPRTRRFMYTVGGLGLLLGAIMFYVGYEAAYKVPGRGYYNLKAQFGEADNLANHYEVRIGGRRAGQVLPPRVKDGQAEVDLRLDDKFKPLLSDTKMQVRLRSAVGVRYLDLIPGEEGAPLPEGATIGTRNELAHVALDEVLGTFDPATRAGTRKLIANLGAAGAGNGDKLNAALGSAPGFFEALDGVSQAITSRPGAMRGLIRGGAGAASAFAPVSRQIAEGFAPEAAAARAFADTGEGFSATLEQAPGALDAIRTGLPSVDRLVAQVDGLARQGLPTLRSAPASLSATTTMLDDSRPALDAADGTLQRLDDAVSPTLALLHHVQPELPRLDATFAALLPQVREIAPRSDCDLSNFFTGWSEYMKWGTSYGNFIRFTPGARLAEEPAGSVGGGGQGSTPQERFLKRSPYPAPCTADHVGEAGPERPSAEESAKGYAYSRAREPGFATKPEDRP
jgi:ABC-type transporter Mla subunit MlaD